MYVCMYVCMHVGFPKCEHLQAGSTGSRNHNGVCRSRIEACLDNTSEGHGRKDGAAQRREDQLTRELERQDELTSKTVAVDAAAAPDVFLRAEIRRRSPNRLRDLSRRRAGLRSR